MGRSVTGAQPTDVIQQGGARVDGEPANDDVSIPVSGDIKISAGKKMHGLLTP